MRRTLLLPGVSVLLLASCGGGGGGGSTTPSASASPSPVALPEGTWTGTVRSAGTYDHYEMQITLPAECIQGERCGRQLLSAEGGHTCEIQMTLQGTAPAGAFVFDEVVTSDHWGIDPCEPGVTHLTPGDGVLRFDWRYGGTPYEHGILRLVES